MMQDATNRYSASCSDKELAQNLLEDYPYSRDLVGNPLEELFLYSGDPIGPERYMRVFAIAEGKAEEAGDIERQISFMIESLNGARRRPGKWEEKSVLKVMDTISNLLATLQLDDARKLRLQELHLYHTGLVHHLFGNFRRAEKAQDEAGKIALQRGDEVAATIQH